MVVGWSYCAEYAAEGGAAEGDKGPEAVYTSENTPPALTRLPSRALDGYAVDVGGGAAAAAAADVRTDGAAPEAAAAVVVVVRVVEVFARGPSRSYTDTGCCIARVVFAE